MFITTCQKNYRSVSVCTMHEERGDFYTVFYYEPPAPSAGHSLLLSTPCVLQLLLLLFSSHTTGVECKTVHTFLSWICSNCIVSQNVRLYSFEWVVLGFERVIWKGGVVRDTVQLLNIHERNVFTVPRITLRQIGQSDRDFAHASQQTKWPHGRKTVLVSRSMHTLHVLASRSLRFFSSSDAASSAVPSVSGLSVIVTEVATLDDALSSETCTHTTWT